MDGTSEVARDAVTEEMTREEARVQLKERREGKDNIIISQKCFKTRATVVSIDEEDERQGKGCIEVADDDEEA